MIFLCNGCFSLFENPGSVVSVEPIAKAVTFVNGVAITRTTVLHHVSSSLSDSCYSSCLLI